MRSPCSRRGCFPAATRTPSAWTPSTRRITWTPASSSSTIATIPTSSACWRPPGCASQPSNMSFGVSDGGDFEYNGASPNGLFAKRAHLVTPWFHRMIADLVRFNRDSRALLSAGDDGPSLGDWLDERGYSRPFIERLIVPQASAVWSADPRQMWTLPRALSGAILRQSRDVRVPRSPAVAHDRQRIAHVCERRGAPVARPAARIDPRSGDTQVRESRRDRYARRRIGAFRPRGDRDALRPGATDARGCHARASTRSSARSRTRATRPSCTPTSRCCRAGAAPGRAGTTTCCPSPSRSPRSRTT